MRAAPYRNRVKPGGSVELQVNLRNFLSREQAYRVELHTPPGLSIEPSVIEARLDAGVRRGFSVRVTAAPNHTPGVQLLGFDITRDGRRCGELFDAIVEVTP